MDLEICVNSIQSAHNAKAGGATRIELCQALEQGGTTPSYSTIEYCTKELKLRTYVLIRPRSGNFMYNALEFENIRREVILCRQLGATGVVVGFLDSNLDIDISKTKEIVALAEDMEVTFHRAFDICNNPLQNLEKVIDCGCTRILTSGCKATAHKGMDMLKKLTNQANGRIKIMAGSGINAANAIEIINTTGVDEIHASCKHVVGNWNETDVEQFLDPSNSMYSETDSDEVRRLSSLIAQI